MGAFFDRYKTGQTAPTSSGTSFVAQRYKQIQEEEEREKQKEKSRVTSGALASGQYVDPAMRTLQAAGRYAQEQRAKPQVQPGFVKSGLEGAQALRRGEIGVKDVAKELYPSTKKVTFKVLDELFPGAREAVGETFGMFGEAIAYGVDKEVRKQYALGNTDILPLVTNLRHRDNIRNTIAAGLNATIYGRIPALAQMTKAQRLTQGGLEGIGFAVADGIAEGTPAEEMVSKMTQYGVPSAVLALIAPQLIPLLTTEVKNVPKFIVDALRKPGAKAPPRGPTGRSIQVTRVGDEMAEVPFSNRYIPESDLPVIEAGPGAKSELPVIQTGFRETTDLGGGYRIVPEEAPTAPAGQAVPKTEPRTVEVPQEQLPVGTGAQKASTLEARMTGTLSKVSEGNLDEAGVLLYRQMNRQAQKTAAARFVADDPEGAMQVLLGNRPAPEGLLNQSIMLALSESAESMADRALAVRLGSLRATRYGQEISFLAEAQEGSVIGAISDIIEARVQRSLRGKPGGTKPQALIAKEGKEFKRALQDVQIKDANDIIKSMEC